MKIVLKIAVVLLALAASPNKAKADFIPYYGSMNCEEVVCVMNSETKVSDCTTTGHDLCDVAD